jgi:hypothetical protein
VPFHRSARVLPPAVPPTAVQAEREVHATLFRAPPPEGLGVAWMRQATGYRDNTTHDGPPKCAESVAGSPTPGTSQKAHIAGQSACPSAVRAGPGRA